MPSGPLEDRLAELASIHHDTPTVISAYLVTSWTDEHQRERTRVFLKDELRHARAADQGDLLGPDLDWIEAQGAQALAQENGGEVRGLALFACSARGLRETVALRVPTREAFVVSETPCLRPLVEAAQDTPPAAVVFVDGESARLARLGAAGIEEEISLESEVGRHHRRGGWALLLQSRYQRSLQEERRRHVDAVADALASLAEAHPVRAVVLAGEPRNTALLRAELSAAVAKLVTGTVSAARHEATAVIVERAEQVLRDTEARERAAEVDEVLTAAAKHAQATAGVAATLTALARAAVRRLYLLGSYSAAGSACSACAAIQLGEVTVCRTCGNPVRAVEVGEAMVQRTLSTRGAVTVVPAHPGLERVGGVAALLRHPL